MTIRPGSEKFARSPKTHTHTHARTHTCWFGGLGGLDDDRCPGPGLSSKLVLIALGRTGLVGLLVLSHLASF
jgi:hypothetical protein